MVQIRMNNNIKNAFTKTLLAASFASASSVSHAASFALIEQSASGQGSAYAGAAALGEDASTIYFNPAGMTRLSGQQIVVAGHIISPNAKFTNDGSTDALGTDLPGPNSSTGDPSFVPNFYYTATLPNDIHVGVGVNVPFGLATDYDDGWVGRYHTLHSEITSINVNPSIAWKATEKLAVGFGISIQYLDLELTNNIDSYGACINLASQSQGAFTGADCVNAGLTGLGIAGQDSKVKLAGDSLEIGWNAGILYDLDDKNRIGIAYRSAIKHNVSGDATYSLDPRLQPFADNMSAATGFNILQSTTLEAAANLPESFSLSLVGVVDEKWTALFDWTWTGWAALDSITIVQAGGVPGQEPTLHLAYQNTNRYSVGVNFKPDNTWIYRGGLALDKSPIRSPETMSARIPGNDRYWLSLGLGYVPASNWSFDVGYTHIFMSDSEINNNAGASSSNATLKGTYETSVDILSAQANFNF
jgi:long-chain fatty acid transport protein